MMSGDVGVLELVQQLTGERSRADENHIFLRLLGHFLCHEINAGELWVIDRQAVVALDKDPLLLSERRYAAQRSEQQ